jgi:hypothetical protein
MAATVLLAASTVPAAVTAQARGFPLGEYQIHVTRPVAGPVLPAAHATAAGALLDAILPIVRGNSAAASSPPDMCIRLFSHAWSTEPDLGAAVELSLMFPIVIDGQCYNLTTTAVAVRVNDLKPLLNRRVALPGPPAGSDGEPMFMPLRPQPSPASHPRFGDVVMIARPGASPFLPVTKEQYLRALERGWQASLAEVRRDAAKTPVDFGAAWERWVNGGRAERIAATERTLRDAAAYLTPAQLAEMQSSFERSLVETERALQAMASMVVESAPRQDAALASVQSNIEQIQRELAGLSPADRQLPACLVDETAWVSAGPRLCPVEQQPIVANRAYWDRTKPKHAAQVILVQVGHIERRRNDTASEAARRAASQQALMMRLFETLDYAALAALIR